jgi:hypothetical protein
MDPAIVVSLALRAATCRSSNTRRRRPCSIDRWRRYLAEADVPILGGVVRGSHAMELVHQYCRSRCH